MAGDTSGVLQLATNGSTTALTIDTSQNVGIGTTATGNLKLAMRSTVVGTGLPASSGTTPVGNLRISDASNIAIDFGSYNTSPYPAWVQVHDTGDQSVNYPLSLQPNGGNVGIGGTPSHLFDVQSAANQNVVLFRIYSSQYTSNTLSARAVAGNSSSATNAAFYVGQNTGTSRSINAGGTINASGTDYAEYMTKAGDFTIAKGDVCGIDANGKLTNIFADAISFVVKSTSPSYVGGDTWFTEEQPEDADLLPEWENKLEEARKKVDRIAFSGQVPVNVEGAVSGQYIIPVNDNGVIKGEAVSNPTFEQYQIAVGKVIAIEADGRARIIVKVA
jgi:hypothetical protein